MQFILIYLGTLQGCSRKGGETEHFEISNPMIIQGFVTTHHFYWLYQDH